MDKNQIYFYLNWNRLFYCTKFLEDMMNRKKWSPFETLLFNTTNVISVGVCKKYVKLSTPWTFSLAKLKFSNHPHLEKDILGCLSSSLRVSLSRLRWAGRGRGTVHLKLHSLYHGRNKGQFWLKPFFNVAHCTEYHRPGYLWPSRACWSTRIVNPGRTFIK